MISTFDRLGTAILLRVLRDPRVKAVAIERYGLAELQKLIDRLAAAPPESPQDKPS